MKLKTLVVAPNVEYYFDKEKGTDIVRLKDKKKEFTPFYASSGIQSAILPSESIGSYYITEEGTLQNIVDTELHMVSGLQLDGISELVDDNIAALNTIIYGG